MLTSEVLKKAQRAIVEHGWVKGNFGDEEQGFCMMGAIGFALQQSGRGGVLSSAAYQTLSDQIYKENGDNYEGVTHYNDKIAKDKKDVEEMFNRAITLAKMRERQ